MPEQAQSPFYNFPRFFPMRGGGGGYQAGNAGAISRFGDDIAQSLMQIKAQMDQKKQDELANAMMNNGQSPGAAPYVRRAEYPDGDQGDDPGPVPFDSTNAPYTGGQQQQATLAGSAAQQQKAQQQQLAQAMASRGQDLRKRQLDLEEQGLGIKAAGRAPKTSKLLPPSLGDDNLPTNEPAMPAPTTGSVGPSGMPSSIGGIVSALGNLFGGGGSTPDAAPSPTPLIAQRPEGDPIAAGRAIKSDPSLSREQKIAKLRELGFK